MRYIDYQFISFQQPSLKIAPDSQDNNNNNNNNNNNDKGSTDLSQNFRASHQNIDAILAQKNSVSIQKHHKINATNNNNNNNNNNNSKKGDILVLRNKRIIQNVTAMNQNSLKQRRDKLLGQVPGIEKKNQSNNNKLEKEVTFSYNNNNEACNNNFKNEDEEQSLIGSVQIINAEDSIKIRSAAVAAAAVIPQMVKTAENFFDATKMSNKIKLRPLSPKFFKGNNKKAKKSNSPQQFPNNPPSRGSTATQFFQTAANGFLLQQQQQPYLNNNNNSQAIPQPPPQQSPAKSSLMLFFDQHKNSLNNQYIPPSRPTLKPINPHSTAQNWNSRQRSLPLPIEQHSQLSYGGERPSNRLNRGAQPQQLYQFPGQTQKRPDTRRKQDSSLPATNVYGRLDAAAADPYSFRATATGVNGFWHNNSNNNNNNNNNNNVYMSNVRNTRGVGLNQNRGVNQYQNNKLPRSLNNSQQRRGSHQISINQKTMQHHNIYDQMGSNGRMIFAGSSAGFQAIASSTSSAMMHNNSGNTNNNSISGKFRGKKKSYNQNNSNDVIHEIKQFPNNQSNFKMNNHQQSPAQQYYGNGISYHQRQSLNNSYSNSSYIPESSTKLRNHQFSNKQEDGIINNNNNNNNDNNNNNNNSIQRKQSSNNRIPSASSSWRKNRLFNIENNNNNNNIRNDNKPYPSYIRNAQPTLSDLAKQNEINFERNHKMDVRQHLTDQVDSGINLLFYDWNNSKNRASESQQRGRLNEFQRESNNNNNSGNNNNNAKERPVGSRVGKRATAQNFFSNQKEKTPKNEKKQQQQDVGYENINNNKKAQFEQRFNEEGGQNYAGAGGRKAAKQLNENQTKGVKDKNKQSPRGMRVTSPNIIITKKHIQDQKQKKRAVQKIVTANDNFLMEQIVEEDILSPVH